MSSSSQSTVLVVGSSGNTGFPVSTALLESGKFKVILLCRPGTENKPRITALKQKGAQIRVGDIVENSLEELEKRVLNGVEILIIMVSSLIIGTQTKILTAASKCKSIKRVVPSEFALVHLSGDLSKKSQVLNKQIEIRALVKQLNLPYTYINVGWWMDLVIPHPSSDNGYLAQRSRQYIGDGTVQTAVISRADIGQLVALVLADPRTVDTQVFGCGDQVSLNDIYDLADKLSGEDLRSKKIIITAEEFSARLEEAQKNYELAPSHLTLGMQSAHIANHIMFVDGENTTDMAVKKLGYLDACVLYPETFKPQSMKEFAKEFYKGEVDGISYPKKD